ncbi:MAG TPA: type II toxin-antitoxin system HicB family antitoxin [Stenotrophomonas sp.]|nr:type II toxin-antitoxin system HicB family antitoxin [Stenotrophomonas sp.]
MRYPVMIESGNEHTAYSIVVPDLPGCFSASDNVDDAIDAAEEAARAWIDAALDAGQAIPRPSSVQAALNKGDFSGWMVAFINVDPAVLDDTTERVNITLPRRVLTRLDTRARDAGETRSGFIAQLAMG